MKQRHAASLMLVGCLFVMASVPLRASEDDEQFELKIRPILAGTCFRCHGDSKTAGELRVDSREALLAGGDSGPAIVPGKPDESLLIRAISRHADVSAMPPEKDKALLPRQVADFAAWIKAGAPWPERVAKFETKKHWAFEPLRDPVPPQVQDAAWPRTSIDSFILARQEAAGVRPAPPADKLTFIRRATFDLTGLPPTPAEVDTFLQDNSPQAFETVVERLLASPAYGERWGRHWLDVVRFADTAGETADYPVPLAWRYRNYVIDAFNADKPYDEFLREQIAGDILALSGPRDRYAERVTATGYLAISRRFGFDSENYHHLTIQDTIDTLGQSVLGLSLGCARCHDHKFDAVTMRDYYALYGIFDSSRYAFPGSEQKPRLRCMAPLLPPEESESRWRDFESTVAAMTQTLTKLKQPVPAAALRSLQQIDGDFELNAPANGGSNGVLVPPWIYAGPVAVTNAAQSPFKNVYPQGKVGASVAAGCQTYRIEQGLYPRRTSANCQQLHVNLDFRVAATDAPQQSHHRLSLAGQGGEPAIEVLITSNTLALRSGASTEVLGPLQPNTWTNLQLTLDLRQQTVRGIWGVPGGTNEFSQKPLGPNWSGAIDRVLLSGTSNEEAKLAAIEVDNLAVQTTALAIVSTEASPPTASPAVPSPASQPDPVALTEQLQALSGIDGDFELQTLDKPPATPWGPGPNSVVQLSDQAQSPLQNIFPRGELGVHMPNRAPYDGFGQALDAARARADQQGRLYVSFDFRCSSREAGGEGSWRYYLGHGPGNSAAVELYFNGQTFTRRSGDAKDVVCPLAIGVWYQVQLTLDLKAKTYQGMLLHDGGKTDFQGQLATGWDGAIDYTFIDSYGHIGGVRPALDADNFILSDKPLPSLDAPAVPSTPDERRARRDQALALRDQLAALQLQTDRLKQDLNTLLIEGPFAMAYGIAEGTPHDVHIQLRGEPDQPGPVVPRGLIQSLGGQTLPATTQGSGRLELAAWLTRPDNPLTARVMVNRIWQYHFGSGLVKTPNDFGVRGQPPTHPELLDHLAVQFVRGGWSIKALHRLIMLSATYQQAPRSGAATDQSMAGDLYDHFPRRRLSAEEIRDAILAVSGELNATPAQAHPFPAPIQWSYSQHGPFSAVYDHNQRSIYLMTQRLKRHPFLALFDGTDPNTTTAARMTTTVPTQALFFLNDPFVHAKAEQWASRLLASSTDENQRVELAWRRALGHAPSEADAADARQFLTAYRQELSAMHIEANQVETRAWAAYLRTLIGSNEFLHVE